MAAQILIIGSAVAARQDLAELLSPYYEVKLCPPDQLGAELGRTTPDLAILMEDSDEMHQLVRQLKTTPATRDIPLILAPAQFSERRRGLGTGGRGG